MYIIRCNRCKAEFNIDYNEIEIKAMMCFCGEREDLLIAQKAPVAKLHCSDGLSAFTNTEKDLINNLDARLKRRGFSFLATDYITLQDIIPKLKALLDEGR